MSDLSIVVPVYNEAAVIERVVEDLGREVRRLVPDAELIVVDDASTDDTPAILERLAQERPWLRVGRQPQNAGHGAAVSRGLAASQSEWILQLDSDGQFDVSEFPLLWQRRDLCDLALGVRVSRRDPAHRLFLSRIVRLATSALAGRRLRDVNTPFRLLRRACWDDLRTSIPPDALAPNVLVTLGAVVRGWRVEEIPVTHLPRDTGTSTLRALRLVGFSLRGLAQLVAFRARLARGRRETVGVEQRT